MRIYLVGGAVRDTLLGIEPKDRDYVVVDSSVEEMLSLGFTQVGVAFPVFLNTKGEEYALARAERKTGQGYQGFEFDTKGVTLIQDLGRRDLTVNAMAIDLDTGELIDPYGGQKDLANGILRHVSDAFAEDPARVFRVAKFASRYGFTVHDDTIKLMTQIKDSGELEHLARERIVSEILAVMSNKYTKKGLDILIDVGALAYFSWKLEDSYIFSELDVLCNIITDDPDDKLGAFIGNAFIVSQEWQTDKQRINEMRLMKLSSRAIKMALWIKNFGFMDMAHNCKVSRVLDMLKQMEFFDMSESHNAYRSICHQVISGTANTPSQYLTEVFDHFDLYVKAIRNIDNEAIASQFNGNGNGKAISVAIKAAQINAIMQVDCNHMSANVVFSRIDE